MWTFLKILKALINYFLSYVNLVLVGTLIVIIITNDIAVIIEEEMLSVIFFLLLAFYNSFFVLFTLPKEKTIYLKISKYLCFVVFIVTFGFFIWFFYF